MRFSTRSFYHDPELPRRHAREMAEHGFNRQSRRERREKRRLHRRVKASIAVEIEAFGESRFTLSDLFARMEAASIGMGRSKLPRQWYSIPVTARGIVIKNLLEDLVLTGSIEKNSRGTRTYYKAFGPLDRIVKELSRLELLEDRRGPQEED